VGRLWAGATNATNRYDAITGGLAAGVSNMQANKLPWSKPLIHHPAPRGRAIGFASNKNPPLGVIVSSSGNL
jgi:hypothetical protein